MYKAVAPRDLVSCPFLHTRWVTLVLLLLRQVIIPLTSLSSVFGYNELDLSLDSGPCPGCCFCWCCCWWLEGTVLVAASSNCGPESLLLLLLLQDDHASTTFGTVSAYVRVSFVAPLQLSPPNPTNTLLLLLLLVLLLLLRKDLNSTTKHVWWGGGTQTTDYIILLFIYRCFPENLGSTFNSD